MSPLVEATARKLAVERTGFEYDMLLEEQKAALQAEVLPVIEACGAEQLLCVAKMVNEAYLGEYLGFHTRLNALADGNFAELLFNSIAKAGVA